MFRKILRNISKHLSYIPLALLGVSNWPEILEVLLLFISIENGPNWIVVASTVPRKLKATLFSEKKKMFFHLLLTIRPLHKHWNQYDINDTILPVPNSKFKYSCLPNNKVYGNIIFLSRTFCQNHQVRNALEHVRPFVRLSARRAM